MKAKTFLLILLVLFSLVACLQNPNAPMEAAVIPTFTPYVGGTQTVQAATNQNILPTLPPPTSILGVVKEKPADFSPVLYGQKYDANTFFILLGGASKDVWFTPDESVARFSGDATYSLHTLEQENKYFFWGKAQQFSPTCKTYSISTDIDVKEVGMVAVLDGWNIAKRATTELSADGEFYQKVVLDWLADKGVDEPKIGNLQIFRVDIEGDGVDEIFINATHLDDSQHTTKAGDYSIILMRKVAGNEAVTIPLVADVYSSKELEITYPRTYSLANFIDLNQDGVLEVVVDIQQWEGFGAIVYEIDNQNVTEVFWAEC